MKTNIARIVLTGCLMAATFSLFGQTGEKREAPVRRDRTGLGVGGHWMAKSIVSPAFVQAVGLQEDQAKKIKDELDRLDQASAELDETIRNAAAEQAKIAKTVLSEPGADIEQMIALIEKIGKCRTEQAKLATRRLVVLRDNLTAEQREKAAAFLKNEQKKWHEEHERWNDLGFSAAATNRPAIRREKK